MPRMLIRDKYTQWFSCYQITIVLYIRERNKFRLSLTPLLVPRYLPCLDHHPGKNHQRTTGITQSGIKVSAQWPRDNVLQVSRWRCHAYTRFTNDKQPQQVESTPSSCFRRPDSMTRGSLDYPSFGVSISSPWDLTSFFSCKRKDA